jgi:hypothetical protein
MLAEAEWQSHNDGIQEQSPLLDQISSANSRPEIMLDNLCEHAVWGRKSINYDIYRSLFSLRNSMKELPKILQRGSLHNLIEWVGRNLKYWYTNDLANDLWINLNHMPLNRRLKDNATALILNNR